MNRLSLLLRLSDSALPTGGFSHSFGLELYLNRGEVHDETSFIEWLRVFVATQLTHTDALAMRMLFEGADEADLTDLIHASTLPVQIRAAEEAIAKRLRAIGADALGVEPAKVEPSHPAFEFAWICRHHGVDQTEAILAHLVGTIATLTQNAVRGIPIGQSAGQRVLSTALPWAERAAQEVFGLDYAEFGIVAPGLEIAQMQHERLHARMFMS